MNHLNRALDYRQSYCGSDSLIEEYLGDSVNHEMCILILIPSHLSSLRQLRARVVGASLFLREQLIWHVQHDKYSVEVKGILSGPHGVLTTLIIGPVTLLLR